MTLFWLVVGNLARRVLEYAERHADQHDRHIIDLLRDVVTSR